MEIIKNKKKTLITFFRKGLLIRKNIRLNIPIKPNADRSPDL